MQIFTSLLALLLISTCLVLCQHENQHSKQQQQRSINQGRSFGSSGALEIVSQDYALGLVLTFFLVFGTLTIANSIFREGNLVNQLIKPGIDEQERILASLEK
nr:uncharacterized protein LOC121128243 isoform X2 [Lepeophtheirus salmonis]